MEDSLNKNTLSRYEHIRNILASGSSELSSADYQFYKRYCRKNDIEPEKVSVGVSERSSKDEYQKERYEALMAGLNKGRSISATDYRFLKRYCKEHGIALPDMELHLYARLKK
jgi:hypothetical protein